MIAADKPNPFRVLALATDATTEDIVARGQELSHLAESDEERVLCRWAMEQLITHPMTRLEWELFEVPGAQYRDEAWERFVRTHRRSPVDLAALGREAPPPRLEDFDLAALARLLAESLIAAEPVDLACLVDRAPVTFEIGPPPVEVGDVAFG